jgi:N-methylhydantoinase A/oxoprolinase/acetone carboxylase beta subunit
VIVPPDAGVSSAHGLLVAPLSFDFVRSAPSSFAAISWEEVAGHLDAMEREGRSILARAGLGSEPVLIQRLCDLRFHGQGTELSIELPPGPVTESTAVPLAQAFKAQYSALYRHVPSEVPLEVISWRVVASSAPPRASVVRSPATGDPIRGARMVWWGPDDGFVETTVLDRHRLAPGASYDGPLIVEERESTTVADPRSTVTVDERLNLVVDLHS